MVIEITNDETLLGSVFIGTPCRFATLIVIQILQLSYNDGQNAQKESVSACVSRNERRNIVRKPCIGGPM